MEQTTHVRRRKTEEEEDENQWHKLDDAIIETILAQLPTADIVSCQSVCKRWESIILYSSTFSNSVFKNHHSRPLLFNLDSQSLLTNNIVYDMEVSHELKISLPCDPKSKSITIIPASYGLVCYKISSKESNDFSLVVKNPLSRTISRLLPNFGTNSFENILGIAMRASRESCTWNYKVFVVYEKYYETNKYNIGVKVFSSSSSKEKEEEKVNNWDEFIVKNDDEDLNPFYKNPWFDREVLVGVTSLGDEGRIKLYFLHKTKRSLICLDTKNQILFTSRLYYIHDYSSIELVECSGRVLLVHHNLDRVVFWKINPDRCYRTNRWDPIGWPNTRIILLSFKFVDDYYEALKYKMKCTSYGNFIYFSLSDGRTTYLLVTNIEKLKKKDTEHVTWNEIPFECNLVQPFATDFLDKV